MVAQDFRLGLQVAGGLSIREAYQTNAPAIFLRWALRESLVNSCNPTIIGASPATVSKPVRSKGIRSMRKARTALITSLFAAAFVFLLPQTGSTQNREKFVISARAGGVNAVTGRATMRPHGNSEWRQLTIKPTRR